MKNRDKTKEQLIDELEKFRQRIYKLEKSETSRRKAEEAFRKSEEKYSDLVEKMSEGLGVVNARGILTYVNPRIVAMLEYSPEEIVGKHAFTFVDEESIELVKKEANKRRKGLGGKFELVLVSRTGKKVSAIVSAQPLLKKGKHIGSYAIFTDITERKRAEEELKEKEAFNFALFQHSPIETIIVDREGRIVKTNLAKRKSGDRWPNIGDVMYKDYASKHEIDMHAELLECIRSGKKKEFPELKYGDKFLSITLASFPEGAIITSLDITEQTKAQQELKRSQEQLYNLTAHLQSIREEERTLIAREMHDELGQALTALKMDLSWLDRKIPKDQELLLDKIKSMKKLVDSTIRTVKRISTELRPGLLDDLGLPAVIEWQGEEFQNRTGIKCKVTINPNDIILNQDRSTAIFRIFQETLTNVARHANATRVTVRLWKKASKLELKVKDNGKGITEEQISDPQSFGLIGMRERAHFLGGEVKIKGVRDKGTTVIVRIPLTKKGKNQ